jgi:flavorubredoxin
MSAIVINWSATGNTEKVAYALRDGLREGGLDVSIRKVAEAGDVDFFAYDLVCIGCPSIYWHPPKPVEDFLKNKFSQYRAEGRIKPGAPKITGHNVLVFCTYSGPHTGLDEATPVGKYIGQFFAHLGFTVIDEWYVLSEFHNSPENSTLGRMGDIRGRPTEEDLKKIRDDAKALAQTLA